MLKRKIEDDLLQWKNAYSDKACIINGARQVGKTFSAREFGSKNYDVVYELNFLENNALKEIFSGSLDAESLLASIRITFTELQFKEKSTLIFLDEIQECPQAITALKFLSKDTRFDVIASGSALGLAYKSSSSFPVGSTYNINMHALSFEEFLWAKSLDADIFEMLKNHFETKKEIPLAIHNKMLEFLCEYMVVGGMPEVVQAYVDKHDFNLVHTLQKNIYSDYVNDIARFSSPEIKIKAESCYKSIVTQLEKENHKFQYSQVEKKGSARKFESSIDWLVNAHLAYCVFNVSKIEFPLKSFAKQDNFRLYMNDIGLFISCYDFSLVSALLKNEEIEKAEQNNIILKTAKGAIYEALAADILLKDNHSDLYFFRNDQGNIEIDFIIEGKHGAIPLEIKAGAKTKTKSLNRVLENENITFGYKFGSQNIGIAGKKITMPLYMLMFI